MSRYDLPSPICKHVPKVRVSSHADMVAALKTSDAMASTYCCDRDACLADAKEWLYASTHRDEVHVIELPKAADG